MAGLEVAARPEWMDDEFLTTCLISSKLLPKDSNIDITDASLYYVVPKGENYMSLIYRVNVDYHVIGGAKSNGVQNGGVSSDSFIVKVSHETKHLKLIAKEAKIFVKETDMYVNIMPKFTKILNDAGIDGNIACRCLYSVEGEREVLVMEDLKPKGYIIGNRLKGLDLTHAKLVFDKLAKMHAASMHYFSTREVPELYGSSPFDSKNDAFDEMKKMFEISAHKKMANVIAELKKYPKYGNHIIEFFKRYDVAIMDVAHRDWKSIPGNKFNALLHADCWVNNMMFRYNDDGSVRDVLLIDLQISYFSSVANDFIYFFFTSSNKDVRMHHFKYLQKFYIDTLTDYLIKLGYAGEIPTVEEFAAELKRLLLPLVYIISIFNGIILAEFKAEEVDRSKTEVFEIEDMITKDTSKTYNDVLLMSIDLLEENGFFDNYDLPELPATSVD